MRKKILILGSSGMLGHVVYYHFKKNTDYEIFDISYREKISCHTTILDVKNKNSLENKIEEINPDFIINCIGVLVSGSSKDHENAIYLNSFLPHFLAKIGCLLDIKIIHISTDCVFSGERGQYSEKDEKDGKSFYSKTKALGEIVDKKNVTLRTSIIGPELKKEGEGLFDWFMRQTGSIQGYNKAIWSGVTTLELAKAIKWAIEESITGLYHITNGIPINKFELLTLIKKETDKDIEIVPIDGTQENKSFVDTRKLINYCIPTYSEMLKELILYMKENKTIYEKYKLQ